MGNASLIAVDWGTTSLRAWTLDASGKIIARKRDKLGILQVADRGFGAALDSVIGAWGQDSPVLMSGMIGSRQGWVEAPYASCPAGLDEVAKHLAPVPEHSRAFIVPGLSSRVGKAAPDVMRGEETQIFGLDLADGIVILPGTHSKWTLVQGGRVEWFATYFTGELYDVLKRHSILGRLMEDTPDSTGVPNGFDFGLDEALSGGAQGLLHALFTVRTRGLFGEVTARQGPGFLSGLLIGKEIAEARAAVSERARFPASATLVGAEQLTALYAHALTRAGLSTSTAGEDCCAQGLYRIARAAGLVAELRT